MGEGLWREVAFATRRLLRNPLFATVAIVSLAIGLGANITTFAIANALILQPPAGIDNASQLIDIGRTRNGTGFADHTYGEYVDIRDRSRVFTSVYAYTIEPDVMGLHGPQGAESIHGSLVTVNYFSTLGVHAHIGRLFDRRDSERPGESPLVVLNHRFWTTRFNADASVVGRQITLNGHPFTIVGVAAAGFHGTTILSSDVWVPIGMVAQAVPARSDFLTLPRGSSWISIGARLKPGVTLEQARAELVRVAAGMQADHPSPERYSLRAAPLAPIPGNAAPAAGLIGLLMTLGVMVLGVACANVAGVMLARGMDRRGELAVRAALGASRGRLVRELLVETTLLFVAGGAAALMLGRMMLAGLESVVPSIPMPVSLDPQFDPVVIVFAATLSLMSALVSGIPPAMRATRPDLVDQLNSDTPRGPRRQRLRAAFVAVQVAFSVVLIVSGTLLARTVAAVAEVDADFHPDGLELATVDLSLAGYTDTTGRTAVRQLIERVRAIPSVESASLTRMLPLSQNALSLGGVGLAGDPPRWLQPRWNIVETGYFQTINVALVRGRDFVVGDTSGAPPVAIVNDTAARQWWPGADPIGQTLTAITENRRVVMTVVGVARDTASERLRGPLEPMLFVPLHQRYQPSLTILARSRGGQRLAADLRAAIASFDATLPIVRLMTFNEYAALGLAPQRIAAWVASLLGTFASALAALGLYGMVAYVVTSHRRELGIRAALGATRVDIGATVLRAGLRPAAIGLIAGLALAAGAGEVLSSMLFGVPAIDPIAFGLITIGFVGLALAACALPLRRALAVDPAVTLRDV